MLYRIVDEATNEILDEVSEPPIYLPPGTILVQDSLDIAKFAIEEVNNMAKSEIVSGYIHDGVRYTLSETDQLNYIGMLSLIESSDFDIQFTGEIPGNKYHPITMSSDDAKVLISSMFSYISDVLSLYRAIKGRIASSGSDSDVSEIVSMAREEHESRMSQYEAYAN